ncbi:hypothetical protein [Micromonospora sp. DPT]|uniref:hypothetical protein n=1 Tax=Micromonospora sp. DPT TaxID=3142975 RepID=UPI003207E403
MNVVSPARLAEWQRLSPWSLTWAEVDPARHPFDPGSAAGVVRGLPPAAGTPICPPGPGEDGMITWRDEAGWRWSREMTAALVDHYGRWSCGWWSAIGSAHLADRTVDRTLGRSSVAPEVRRRGAGAAARGAGPGRDRRTVRQLGHPVGAGGARGRRAVRGGGRPSCAMTC